MAINVKGGGAPPPGSQPAQPAADAVTAAFVRLDKKRRKGGDDPADVVADILDRVIGDSEEIESERDAARQLADEISDNLPPGSGMQQAEAIAEALKQKIESTRGQRAHLARKLRAAFDDADE